MKFEDLLKDKSVLKSLRELNYTEATPIQQQAFKPILSGRDLVGIAQTGTGKTFAYLLPIIQDLKYTNNDTPRVLILVPTRELVVQVVQEVQKLIQYNNLVVKGVYGGTNINTQKLDVIQPHDIIVGTPGRLYDLYLSGTLKLKTIKKWVIDEVDIMLDMGFRYQFTNLFEILPIRHQNIMFSATMTEEVSKIINDLFINPKFITIAISGTPLENIAQFKYAVKNIYTKINLLADLLNDKETYAKVLVFVKHKRQADLIFQELEESYSEEIVVIHSNKAQNYRLRSVNQFDAGAKRILVATDVIARGIDMANVTHVINFNVPIYPENYIHRIGRTGRAETKGTSILFYADDEQESVEQIEELMGVEITENQFPEYVEVSSKLTREEQPYVKEIFNKHVKKLIDEKGAAFHEKKDKNKKVNLGGKYHRETKHKYKKPKSRGGKHGYLKNKKK